MKHFSSKQKKIRSKAIRGNLKMPIEAAKHSQDTPVSIRFRPADAHKRHHLFRNFVQHLEYLYFCAHHTHSKRTSKWEPSAKTENSHWVRDYHKIFDRQRASKNMIDKSRMRRPH